MLTVNPSYSNNNAYFQGIQKSSKEVKNMDEMLKKALKETLEKLKQNIEGKFPEYGDFNVVYEAFENPDKSGIITDYMLKITKPPKEIVGHEKIRNLCLTAYRLPSDYIAERLLVAGSKKEIIEALNKPDMVEKLFNAAKGLEHSMSDM